MKTKRVITLFFSLVLSCICMGQKVNDERTLNKFGNELYIVYNNSKYKVDESRIIAKLKPQRKLLKAIGEKTHNLGFDILEIPVPEGIKVEDFLMSLYHTEDFDFLDYCTYGNYYFTPNDELLGNQESNQWYLEKIHAYNACDITTGNTNKRTLTIQRIQGRRTKATSLPPVVI